MDSRATIGTVVAIGACSGAAATHTQSPPVPRPFPGATPPPPPPAKPADAAAGDRHEAPPPPPDSRRRPTADGAAAAYAVYPSAEFLELFDPAAVRRC